MLESQGSADKESQNSDDAQAIGLVTSLNKNLASPNLLAPALVTRLVLCRVDKSEFLWMAELTLA